MAFYELTVLARQDLAQAQVDSLTTAIAQLVSDNNGSCGKQEYWGLRTLAYRMNKSRKAHYLYFDVTLAEKDVAEVDRLLGLNEDIMRFLFVKTEKFSDTPTVMILSKQREEQRSSEGGFEGRPERGNRDSGYRPRPRADSDE